MTSTNPTNNETQKPKQTNSNRKSKFLKRDEVKSSLNDDQEGIPEFKNEYSSSSSPVEQISNALVVCICISDYKGKELPGVKKDKKIAINLWHKIYGYKVLTTSEDEPFVDNDKFWKILQIARDELKKNNGTKYDALILVLSGHGNENGEFLTSDYAPQKMQTIREYFNGNALPTFVERPKIFFVDACRGGKDAVVVEIHENALSRGSKIVRKLKNPSDNFTVVYGNVKGYKAYDDPNVGGFLIRAMEEIFAATNNTATLLQIAREMRKYVAKLEARMVVEVQETAFYDISFAANESGKWRYENENEYPAEWVTYKSVDQVRISEAWANHEEVVVLDEIRKVKLCYDDENDPHGTQICIKKHGGSSETDVIRKDMSLLFL